LLIGLEHEDNESSILLSSYKLCNHDQYKRVYIVADKTKFERKKHKKLVDELKQKRADGETNLIIRNGSILSLDHSTSLVGHLLVVHMTQVTLPDKVLNSMHDRSLR